MAIDWTILNWFQAHRTSFFDQAMPLITRFGDMGLFWIAVTVVLCIIPGTRKFGLSCAVALGLNAILCNLVLKPVIARPRPFTVYPLQLLITAPGDYSFPSGHTSASFTVTVALWRQKSRLWIPCCILSALIAVSRMYLYVHYPMDVLGGLLVGIFSGILGDWIFRKIAARASTQKSSV